MLKILHLEKLSIIYLSFDYWLPGDLMPFKLPAIYRVCKKNPENLEKTEKPGLFKKKTGFILGFFQTQFF